MNLILFLFLLICTSNPSQSINPTSWYLELSTSLYSYSHSSECHLFLHSWSSGIFSGPFPIYSLHRSLRDISGIQTWSSVAKPAMALLTLGRNSLTQLMTLCLFPHPHPSRWLHHQACLLPSTELILLSIPYLSRLHNFCLYWCLSAIQPFPLPPAFLHPVTHNISPRYISIYRNHPSRSFSHFPKSGAV